MHYDLKHTGHFFSVMHVCRCVDAFFLGECACVYTHVQRSEIDNKAVLWSVSTLDIEVGSLTGTQSLPIWLVSQQLALGISAFHMLGLQVDRHTYLTFMWVLKIWSPVFMLAQTMNHPPASTSFFHAMACVSVLKQNVKQCRKRRQGITSGLEMNGIVIVSVTESPVEETDSAPISDWQRPVHFLSHKW